MKRLFSKNRIICFVVSLVLIFSCGVAAPVPVSGALTQSQINNEISELEKKSKALTAEINDLKNKKAAQNTIKQKIEAQIANTQQQITLCNQRISQYNNEIAENEAKIKEKQGEMEDTIFLFKQRLRTIHMSNGSSTIQVLLGAQSFSEYLSLAQLTKVITAHDQKVVERIKSIMDEIRVVQQQINEKITAQSDAKATLAAKQAELDEQVASVNSVIADINNETYDIQQEVRKTEADIKALEKELEQYIHKDTGSIYDGGQFLWPVPGHSGITSYYGKRWGTWHYGIDISDGGIYNAPIVAVADGEVVRAYNSCPHNYKKYRSCGCGGGWGNYVMVDHGNYQGTNYKTLAGHMTRAIVSTGQKVKKGQVIGYVGTTGYSTGYHCHFEVYVNGSRVNPMNYYKKTK